MSQPSRSGTDPHDDGTMSTVVLKAMAHPLRRRILNALSASRSGRAADLAERLGVPANKLSFHLRVLADAGLVEEAPELARDNRDRVWKRVSGDRSLGSPDSPVEDSALAQAVLAGFVADYQDVLRRVAAWAPGYTSGTDPLVRGNLTEATLRMTRERFEQLADEIAEVVNRYRNEPESGDMLGWDLVIVAASEEI